METWRLESGHSVQLLEGAQTYFPALIQSIDASLHEVRMETYIFSVEHSGGGVAAALERAARRGVRVYLMMDGVGTPELPAPWPERFNSAGVQWRIFSPLVRLGVLIPSNWRRLHRKLCVVDGAVAFCGGINVLDDFFDPNHGHLESPRLDFAVRVTGPLVQAVHAATSQFWSRLDSSDSVLDTQVWRALQRAVKHALQGRLKTALTATTETWPPDLPAKDTRAALVLRDNLRNRSRIERSYRQAIGRAMHEIIIANAYFLPGRKLRRGLIHAARRGVRVRLLLQGRYEYFLQYHATRPVYGALLAAGVEISEYASSFLHAKVAVIDGRWATVGSSNLDPLSLLLAREANVVVDDPVFAHELRSRLEQAMAHGAVRIAPETYASRSWRQRLLERIALGLTRVLLFLSGRRY
jgi:cardiolipin synthase A/B